MRMFLKLSEQRKRHYKIMALLKFWLYCKCSLFLTSSNFCEIHLHIRIISQLQKDIESVAKNSSSGVDSKNVDRIMKLSVDASRRMERLYSLMKESQQRFSEHCKLLEN
jgi:hypothetical protein